MRTGESLSIENQKLILTKYVKEQGWNLVNIYVDNGYSETDFNRPGATRLLEDAKTGKINLIICKDISRFGRNYIQVGQYIDYIFPTYNIRFIALNDNVDTANKDINAIVLEDIRSMADLVVADEDYARKQLLLKKEQISAHQNAEEQKKLRDRKHRLEELKMLIPSIYEDKVLGKIPEDVCVNLLEKYQV